jgi:hypothetical protein
MCGRRALGWVTSRLAMDTFDHLLKRLPVYEPIPSA